MTHLAIWEAPAEGPESEWGEQVSEAEYISPEAVPASAAVHGRLRRTGPIAITRSDVVTV